MSNQIQFAQQSVDQISKFFHILFWFNLVSRDHWLSLNHILRDKFRFQMIMVLFHEHLIMMESVIQCYTSILLHKKCKSLLYKQWICFSWIGNVQQPIVIKIWESKLTNKKEKSHKHTCSTKLQGRISCLLMFESMWCPTSSYVSK